MARRIVVEEECPIHGVYGPHKSLPVCPFNDRRRVLDPGSFKAHVADALLFEGWTCDTHEPDPDCEECQVGYERLSQRIWDALAGGEQP
jgi:hypothetical protein